MKPNDLPDSKNFIPIPKPHLQVEEPLRTFIGRELKDLEFQMSHTNCLDQLESGAGTIENVENTQRGGGALHKCGFGLD